MRHAGWLGFVWLVLVSGCWLGEPYEPFQFCIDSDIDSYTSADGHRVIHHTGELVSDAWNDEAQDPIGDCGAKGSDEDLPEWIFRIADEDGNETRFGYTVPELERPIDKDEDEIVTIHAEFDHARDTFGFVVYNGPCDDPSTQECVVEMVGDAGEGGRIITDEQVYPFEVTRADKVARRNGVCGKAELHSIDVRGGGMTIEIQPGDFDVLIAEHAMDHWDMYALNVDNYTWDIDDCGDAQERFSYLLMRGD